MSVVIVVIGEVHWAPLSPSRRDRSCVYIHKQVWNNNSLKKNKNKNVEFNSLLFGRKQQQQVLINSCVFVFPNSFVYRNSNVDFKENRTHYYHYRSITIISLVKKIAYILLTKRKKDIKCACVWRSITIFRKCSIIHRLEGGLGFIEVSRI